MGRRNIAAWNVTSFSTSTSLILSIIESQKSVVQTKEDQQIHSQVTLQAPAYWAQSKEVGAIRGIPPRRHQGLWFWHPKKTIKNRFSSKIPSLILPILSPIKSLFRHLGPHPGKVKPKCHLKRRRYVRLPPNSPNLLKRTCGLHDIMTFLKVPFIFLVCFLSKLCI